MSRNVSESISMMLATETVSLGELLDARMFLEVPLAGPRRGQRHRGDRGGAAGRDRRGRRHTGRARRRSTRPTSASTRSSPRAAGNELLLAFTGWILEVLQPQLIAKHLARASTAPRSCASTATSSARRADASPPARNAPCGLTSVT